MTTGDRFRVVTGSVSSASSSRWFKVIVEHGDEARGGNDAKNTYIIQADNKRHAMVRALDEFDSDEFYRLRVYEVRDTIVI